MDEEPKKDIVLDQYFFTSIEVAANGAHDSTEDYLTIFGVQENTEEIEPNARFAVEVTCYSNEEESTNLPYFFSITAFGLFSVTGEVEENDSPLGACKIIGRRLLMGAIREQIATMTSRGPWASVQLRAIPVTAIRSMDLSTQEDEPTPD